MFYDFGELCKIFSSIKLFLLAKDDLFKSYFRANIWQGWRSFSCRELCYVLSYFGVWLVLIFFCLCSKGYFGAVGALLEMLKMTDDQWWSCLKRFLLQMLLVKSESHYMDGNEAIMVVLPAGFVNNLKSF